MLKIVRNVVDTTNINMGMRRNSKYAQKATDLSGINVVQATEFYQYEHEQAEI